MKATGIVRRIDDLGRVVIPKEIRRTLHLKEGEPLEIFTEGGGEVVFKKYSPVGEISPFADQYAESIYRTMGIPTVICDKDSVVSAFGVSKRELVEKPISVDMVKVLESRNGYVGGGDDSCGEIELVSGSGKVVSCLSPILSEGSSIGAVVTLRRAVGDVPDETEVKVLKTAADFLSRRIDF